MKATLFIATLSTLFLSSTVKAHGFVDLLIVDGKRFSGYLPFQDPYVPPKPARITRRIPDDGPVTDFNSADMTCGKGAQQNQFRTSSHAPVKGGGTVTFHWDRWPDDHRGPVTTYMARCPGNDCTNFNPTGNVWFKIDELGLVKGTTDTGTFATDLLIKNGRIWTVTVPNVEPGAYLMRVEIIALHAAGAPQFYPHCSQFKVTGGGTAKPAQDELVAIPGIYKRDQSTQINIWENLQFSYPIAGPRNSKVAAYRQTNQANLNGGVGKLPSAAGTVVSGSNTPAGGSSSDGGSENGGSTGGSGNGGSSGGSSGNGGSSGSGKGPSAKNKKCKAAAAARKRSIASTSAAEDKSRAIKRHAIRQQAKRRLSGSQD